MWRRRAAAAATQGVRSLLSSRALQPAAEAGGASSSCSSWSRWRHYLAAMSRGGAAAAPASAARAAARPQQQQPNAAAGSSWRQLRQQWSAGRGGGYQHFGGRGQQPHASASSLQRHRRALVITGVAAGGSLLVWVGSQQEVPYTRRSHAIIIGPESETELGKQTFQQVLAEARANGSLLPPNHRATQAVRRIGTRVAKAATDGFGGGFQAHLRQLDWEFAVVDSPQVNAFVVPGGKVVVYTGLLRMVGSEDELAAVLAHECAHVVARHAAERITQMGFLEVGRMLAYWVFGLPIPSGPLSAVFFLPNSRKAEIEADVIGIQIMSRACYDPSGMVSMFEKMGRAEKAEGGDRVPKFLRTHPVSSDRMKAIQRMLPTAEGLYEMNGCDVARGPLDRFRATARAVGWAP